MLLFEATIKTNKNLQENEKKEKGKLSEQTDTTKNERPHPKKER